jgi:CDP-diacylglycerol--serine O-phosphatidyltransferase
MPNGLTLFNLFCGVYAIVLAIRGDIASAPTFIVLGGIADVLDGRVARATGTGSRFGEELDSLVDAISFGFAPALIMYIGLMQLPKAGNWEWLLVFIFTSCAVMRLARFNVEQAGRKKTHFHGLPSPAAGLTLATYYWFSQTPLYNQTVILFTDSKTLSDLPWHTILRGLMAILAALMISDVPYPAVPSIGFSSVRKIIGTLVVAGCVTLLLVRREEFIFPALLAYVLYGFVKWAVLGFVGRSSTPGEIFWDERGQRAARDERRAARLTPVAGVLATTPTAPLLAPVDDGNDNEDDPAEVVQQQNPRRKRRRRGRGHRPQGSPPPGPTLPDSPTGPTE